MRGSAAMGWGAAERRADGRRDLRSGGSTGRAVSERSHPTLLGIPQRAHSERMVIEDAISDGIRMVVEGVRRLGWMYRLTPSGGVAMRFADPVVEEMYRTRTCRSGHSGV